MSDAALTVVIAPDSLKGSCSSPEAARALADGVRSVLGDAADLRVVPMADGGEGTLEALVSAWGGRVVEVATSDALGRPRIGRAGFGQASSGGLRAIVEAADANGLPAVSDVPLRPLDADSAGVGGLILAALDAGADELLLCLGGSATNDGGAGMLRALGARLLDRNGDDIAPGARGLADLHEVDLAGLDPRAARLRWRIACDVDNPLTGPTGAAAVFGPQKGADPEEVVRIDAGLTRLADALAEAAGSSASGLLAARGLGAAGGLALGPVALFGAELVPGAELVSEAVGLGSAMEGADLVITGEGRLDSQSLDGKVVSQVVADSPAGCPVFVVAGAVGLSSAECRAAGISAALSIAQGPATLAELQADALRLLSDAAAQLVGAFAAPRPHHAA
jgi:glycerate kinase